MVQWERFVEAWSQGGTATRGVVRGIVAGGGARGDGGVGGVERVLASP